MVTLWTAFGVTGAPLGTSAAVGDLDGDGMAEVAVGAAPVCCEVPLVDGAIASVSVFGGSAAGPGLSPSWVATGTDDWYGLGLAAGGDVDCDGFGDLAIGDPVFADGAAVGQVSLFPGSAAGPAALPSWTAEDADGPYGWATDFGWTLAQPDVDGDACADVLVGAPADGSGRAFLYSGGPGGPGFAAAWEATAADAGDFGAAATAADLDGDGLAEIAVGDPEGAPFNPYDYTYGVVSVFAGAPGAPETVRAWSVQGELWGDLGASVAAFDVDGDGYADLVAGQPNADQQGHVLLWSGGAAGLGVDPDWSYDGGQLGLAGASLADLGDVTGDGADDLGVGAPWSSDTEEHEGAVAVFAGGPGMPRDVPDWIVFSQQRAAFLGVGLAGGDTQGDGFSDLVAGGAIFAAAYAGSCYDASDADQDGVGDRCDACPGFDDLADADQDGIPDGCDDATTGTTSTGDTAAPPPAPGDTGVPAAGGSAPAGGCGCAEADGRGAGVGALLLAVALGRRRGAGRPVDAVRRQARTLSAHGRSAEDIGVTSTHTCLDVLAARTSSPT